MPPRTRRPSAEVRQLILDAAERVFTAKGYDGSNTDEIAAEAGVARSVLYRHFETKADLFRAAVLVPFTDFLREYGTAWRGQVDEPWDDERLMRTMVELFYDCFSTHRGAVLALAMSADSLDADANAHLDAELDRFFSTMLMISENEVHRRQWMSLDGLDLTIRHTLGGIAAQLALARLFAPRSGAVATRDEVIDHVTRFTLYGLRMAPPPSAP
jgi:AcrR family transcriptional regulator